MIKLWKDKWLGEVTLKQRFPSVFSISSSKEKTVGELGSWTKNGYERNLEWRRERFERDVEPRGVQCFEESKSFE